MSKELEALESIKNHCKHYYDANLSGLGAYKIVEEALKRNEPMKPLLKEMGFEHYNLYCPSCKEYIGYRRNSVRQLFTRKYCPDCGQCIKEEE